MYRININSNRILLYGQRQCIDTNDTNDIWFYVHVGRCGEGVVKTLTVPGYRLIKENEPGEAATSSGSGN